MTSLSAWNEHNHFKLHLAFWELNENENEKMESMETQNKLRRKNQEK